MLMKPSSNHEGEVKELIVIHRRTIDPGDSPFSTYEIGATNIKVTHWLNAVA